MMPEYRGILTLSLVLLGGCTMQPGGPHPESFSAQPAVLELDPLFKPGMLLLTGNEQPKSPAASAADDWVLLGVKVTHDDQQEVWFVRLSGLPANALVDAKPSAPTTKEFSVPFGVGPVKTGAKFTAPTGKLLIETYDSHGTLLRCSLRTVPHFESGPTLMDVLSENSHAAANSNSQSEEARDAVASMLTTMQLMGGSKALAPIRDCVRDQVVQKPSLLGVLINGLKLHVQANVEECKVLQAPWSAGRLMNAREEAKFPVVLGGQRMFDCRMIIGPSAPPYHLTAGTLMFEAVHPENKGNRLVVCVLAAKHEQNTFANALGAVAAK